MMFEYRTTEYRDLPATHDWAAITELLTVVWNYDEYQFDAHRTGCQDLGKAEAHFFHPAASLDVAKDIAANGCNEDTENCVLRIMPCAKVALKAVR
jgi:hypothetical protein